MATVNKNFRIKNGLIVEGGTATVNGFGVLTKAQADQDYIVGLIGGTATSANTANTVVKRDANGNFAAGTITATFVGNLTGDVTGTVSSLSNHDTADLAENAANKYFTDARALSATAAAYDAAGSAAAAQSAATTAAATDATTKVAAEAALRVSGDAASVSTAAADATTKANAAQAAAISAAASDATTKANAAQSAATTAAATDATTKANAAQAAAEATAAADATTKANAAQAAAISAAAADATTKANAAQAAAISAAATAAGTAIATAVDGLVDGAPALLNTLNELAAAINDDANYTTTITTALGTKAPLASPALTGTPTAPTAAADTNTTQIATTAFAKGEADAAQAAAEATAAADATTKANAAQAAAISAAASDATSKANAAQAAAEATAASALSAHSADTTNIHGIADTSLLATTANVATAVSTAASDATTKANAAQAAAEATAAAANTAQQNGTTSFTAINYNSVAKQVAATTGNIAVAAETTAISWVAADYRSAKFVVKVKNGVHTQVSDLVVTLDTANNVAVSEYGITYSNGTELAAVTADYSGSDVRIRVTPANANTEVVVVGTLIK
jgi:hypothetical protein